jgi:hypothetical protein
VTYEGKTDSEVYVEAKSAADELVRRYELLLGLWLDRPNEVALGTDKAKSVKIAERAFRGIYEKLRNLREILDEGEDAAATLKRSRPG